MYEVVKVVTDEMAGWLAGFLPLLHARIYANHPDEQTKLGPKRVLGGLSE